MTEKEYRGHHAISRSDLWTLRESPEKFLYRMENPEPTTPALLFGQVVHKLLLETESFYQEFAVMPSVDKRTKEGKQIYAEFMERSEGKQLVPMADYDKAWTLVSKATESPFVMKLLSGQAELPVFWTDDMTGEDCKCRLDCLTQVGDKLIVVDYKTTSDASTEGFMHSAIKYGYDFQSAMYSEGVEKVFGKKPMFVFIAQEKEAPYSVNILQADDLFIQHGYDIFRELLGTYHYCKETGNWFGYMGKDNIINNLGLPSWLAKEWE